MERGINTNTSRQGLSINDKVAIIGSGNVAKVFAHALDPHVNIVQVCSRDISHARSLAETLTNPDCQAIDSPTKLRTDCSLYIIAVVDDAIADVAAQFPEGISGVVVHTSGSTSIDVLEGTSPHYGSLYPIQTISAGISIAPESIKMLTEASDDTTLQTIDQCAEFINPTTKPTHVSSEQRLFIHVAAVFACNFCNYLWGCSSEIMKDAGLDPSLIEPLIRNSVEKALNAPDHNPHSVQTGPAMRGDLEVISRHIEMLPNKLSEIYRTLSQSIIDHHSNKKK